MFLPANDNLDRLRHPYSHVFSNPRIKNVSRANPKSYAADCARVRRVRIRTHHQLSRKRIALQHNGMANPLGTLAVGKLAVQPDSFSGGKISLPKFELSRQFEQPHLAFLFRKDFI